MVTILAWKYATYSFYDFGSIVLHDILSITLSFISMTRDQVNNTKYNAIVMITAR